jgi:hypothetical protein
VTTLRALAFVLLAWPLTGCERSTHVRIEGGNAPVFILSGSGALASFTVHGQESIEKAEDPFDDKFALWQIQPIEGEMHGAYISQLGSITYGVVPPGYVQIKPQLGQAPALMEGQKYFYEVATTGAPGTAGYLEIRNSRAVPTVGSGVCFGRDGKKWVRVPCPR